jgi:hypothetical protein
LGDRIRTWTNRYDDTIIRLSFHIKEGKGVKKKAHKYPECKCTKLSIHKDFQDS